MSSVTKCSGLKDASNLAGNGFNDRYRHGIAELLVEMRDGDSFGLEVPRKTLKLHELPGGKTSDMAVIQGPLDKGRGNQRNLMVLVPDHVSFSPHVAAEDGAGRLVPFANLIAEAVSFCCVRFFVPDERRQILSGNVVTRSNGTLVTNILKRMGFPLLGNRCFGIIRREGESNPFPLGFLNNIIADGDNVKTFAMLRNTEVQRVENGLINLITKEDQVVADFAVDRAVAVFSLFAAEGEKPADVLTENDGRAMLETNIPDIKKERSTFTNVFKASFTAGIRKGLTRKTSEANVEGRNGFLHFLFPNIEAPTCGTAGFREILDVGLPGVGILLTYEDGLEAFAVAGTLIECVVKSEANAANPSKEVDCFEFAFFRRHGDCAGVVVKMDDRGGTQKYQGSVEL